MFGKRALCFIFLFIVSIIYAHPCLAQADTLAPEDDGTDSIVSTALPRGNSTLVISADQACTIALDGMAYGMLKADETMTITVQKGEHKLVAKTIDGTAILWKQIVAVEENASKVIDIETLVKSSTSDTVMAPAINVNAATTAAKLPALTMVFVEGGTFTMGCTAEQSDCWDNEKLTHQVTLGSFYISSYEITLARFKQFTDSSGYMTDAEKAGWSLVKQGSNWEKQDSVSWRCDVNGRIRPASEGNHPVIHVSWNDAMAYCNWLSRMTGKTYRLPTEAEWEYAARGGNKTETFRYSGNNNPMEVSWYADNAAGNTHAVGQKTPNELGLYDMSGNVWEWCSDWDSDYISDTQTNPTGADAGTNKILRGGSWSSFYWSVRNTNRNNYDPASSCSVNGFRVVMQKD